MPRWIAFDQQTSSFLRSVTQADRIEIFGRGALDYALAKPGAVVTLLPSGGSDIGIAIFRRPRPTQALPRPTTSRLEASSRGIRAGGFLGLSDEPVFEDTLPVQEKKGWWRRFWDE